VPPSKSPSITPTNGPSTQPTKSPSDSPSAQPTISPSERSIDDEDEDVEDGDDDDSDDSEIHSFSPSDGPSLSLEPPSSVLSGNPSENFSDVPSVTPSIEQSALPTTWPTKSPSLTPTYIPTGTPTQSEQSFSQRLPPGIFVRRTPSPISSVQVSTESPTPLPTSLPPTFKYSDFSSTSPTYKSISPTNSPVTKFPSCNMSLHHRKVALFQQLTALSKMELFDDSQHPVSIATSWITDKDPLQLCPGDPNLTQRYSLVLLYFYTSGDSWLTCTRDGTTPCQGQRFLSDSNECAWGGVTCDSLNRVRKLNLDENNMRGSIPQELRYLEYLEELDFDRNSLIGHFPSWVGNMMYLEKLDLDRNVLSGPIPEDLYESTTLQYIDIDRNIISGTISSNIGTMSQLIFFQADFNQLTGTIPTETANIPELQYFSIFGNGFDTSIGIPLEICGLNIQIYANCEMCKDAGDCCTVCLPEGQILQR